MKRRPPAQQAVTAMTAQEISALPVRACRALAQQRKMEGCYDSVTLECYRQVLRQGGTGTDLVSYLSFRRDLGEELNGHYVPLLLKMMPRLGPRAWLEAYNLIVEAKGRFPPLTLHLRPIRRQLSVLAPALVANFPNRRAAPMNPFLTGLAQLVLEQEARRNEFADYLRKASRLCVVGNHAGLAGSGLGGEIDSHECVVRFNQYASPASQAGDIGSKTDVWVRAPGFVPDQIEFHGRWAVITGPDLRYRLSNWQVARPLLERRVSVLTVPLEIWRELVRRLAAPPSAGLLFLAWLRQLREMGLSGISLVGFQRRDVQVGAYHHALPFQPPGRRHNWTLERELLTEWARQDKSIWLERK